MDGLISIGQLSSDMGISIRTIRYYEELGIFKPSRTTDANYRYYGTAEMEKLRIIVFLRKIGFSLQDIKTVLADNRRETMMQMICELHKKMDQEMVKIVEKREILQSLTESLRDNPQTAPLEVVGNKYINGKGNKGMALHEYLPARVIGIGSGSLAVLNKLSKQMDIIYVDRDGQEEDWMRVVNTVKDSEMLLLIASLDDEWVCSTMALIAKHARQAGILTISIMKEAAGVRMNMAPEHIKEHVDMLFNLPVQTADEFRDDAVNCVMTLTRAIFFDDVKEVEDHIDALEIMFRAKGYAQFGSSKAAGPNRVQAVVDQLLGNEQFVAGLNQADSVFLNVSGTNDIKLLEVNKIVEALMIQMHSEVKLMFAAFNDDEESPEGLLLTIVAAAGIAQ